MLFGETVAVYCESQNSEFSLRLDRAVEREPEVKTNGQWMFPLTSALVGGEWSASRPCRFTLGEKAPGTRWAPEPVWATWS
jgi:hypothetical protein